MILILVMIANSFSSCTLTGWIISEFSGNVWWGIGGLAIDIIILVIISGGQIFNMGRLFSEAEHPNETETGIYLTNAEHNPLQTIIP
jgi:hypothetical protein